MIAPLQTQEGTSRATKLCANSILDEMCNPQLGMDSEATMSFWHCLYNFLLRKCQTKNCKGYVEVYLVF